MTLPQALALGVLQGATEFLPISSDGHLALAESLMPAAQRPEFLFDVVLHLATLLAVVLILRQRIFALLQAAVSLVLKSSGPEDAARAADRRWLGLIVVASIPTAVIGLALRDVVGSWHVQPAKVGIGLLLTAALLLVCERFGRRDRDKGDLGLRDAFIIGAAQGFAVLPGLSRSGSTIAAALVRNSRAETAVEFSILISIPAILGANVLVMSDGGVAAMEAELLPYAVGFFAAFVTGVISLKALVWLVAQRHLLPFSIYCALLGFGAMLLG